MQKTGGMTRDLTSGNVVKQLLEFALPLFVSNALQAVYNLVDMVVVGNCIGRPGMSAVSIGGDILHFLTFLAMGFSSAGQVIIAQQVGARENEKLRHTIGTLFTILLGASLVISGICFAFKYNILSWLKTPAGLVHTYTMDYTVTCIFGLFFIYGYNVVSAILRGMGDSRRPFVFIAAAAVINIILDILFVKYFDMKVFGAALATVIGQGVSFIASIVYLYIKRDKFGFDFKPASFVPEKEASRRLVFLGIPMSIQSAAVNFSKIVLTAWINNQEIITGIAYSALGGVYNKVNMMAGIVSNSFTTAGSSMIGQNIGAKKYERVPVILKSVLMFGMIMAVTVSAALVAFPDTIFGIFTDDTEVTAHTGILILPIIINMFGAATRVMAFSIINGSGNTRLNLAVALVDGLISRIGIAYLLGVVFTLGCKGYWLGDALAGFVPFVIGMTYFLTGKWRRRE